MPKEKDPEERLARIQQRIDTKNPLSKSQLIDLLRQANTVINTQRSTILRLEKELQGRPSLVSRILRR